ncbi:MAG: recombinase family protein [Oscillospiraceae bacterium]|nr:recombinase family protein [Oscillospiraceae bacterium]
MSFHIVILFLTNLEHQIHREEQGCESAAETVRLIFDLAAQGQSLAKIATRLYEEKRPTPSEHRTSESEPSCIWSRPVIADILRDEQYIGTYVAGKTKKHEIGSRKKTKVDESKWIKIPNHHPVIVDKAVFDAAHVSSTPKTRNSASIKPWSCCFSLVTSFHRLENATALACISSHVSCIDLTALMALYQKL